MIPEALQLTRPVPSHPPIPKTKRTGSPATASSHSTSPSHSHLSMSCHYRQITPLVLLMSWPTPSTSVLEMGLLAPNSACLVVVIPCFDYCLRIPAAHRNKSAGLRGWHNRVKCLFRVRQPFSRSAREGMNGSNIVKVQAWLDF